MNKIQITISEMPNNNDKLFLFMLLLSAFFIHFTLYGFELFACLFEDMCNYYHSKFYFINLNKNIYLKIYFETLSFYLTLSIVFFLAYKVFFFTKSKISNYILNTKDINLNKFLNILFLFYLLFFLISNQEHFSSIEKLIISFRYKYDPQSLTILWLLGSIVSWENISSKKYFYSILIMITVIFFLYTDGSRLWVLVFIIYLNLFLINFFSISLKFIFTFSLISFGVLVIYVNQMSNPNWRIYKITSEKKETFNLNSLSTSKSTSLSTSKSTSNTLKKSCDFEKFKKIDLFLTLQEIENNLQAKNNIIECRSLVQKQRKFFYFSKKMQLDAFLHVYLPTMYPYEEKINFFDYTLFDLGLIKQKKFQNQNNMAERIVTANNLNESQSNINLSFYGSFHESYPRFYEKIFFIIIIGAMIYLLCYLMSCLSINILNIKYFILSHLIFILGMGVTNHTRATLKLLLFNNFLFFFILVIFYLVLQFKKYKKN